MLKIAIAGAAGRMGQRIIALARESNRFEILAELKREQALNASPKVLIDFTNPTAMRGWLEVCCERGIAFVSGTTGLSADDEAALDRAAKKIAVLHATNMSLGVAVLNKLAAQAARELGPDCDIEIIEAHHRFKKDAPSGTAKSLQAAVVDAIGAEREIGVHSLRMGDELGRHTIVFAALGERLELTHQATNRDTFAAGALHAAEWIAHRPAGRYSMDSVSFVR